MLTVVFEMFYTSVGAMMSINWATYWDNYRRQIVM